MANRGKPLSFDLRAKIKELRALAPLRKVAAAVGVSVNTVRKYGKRV